MISKELLLLGMKRGHESEVDLAYEGESFETESVYSYLNHVDVLDTFCIFSYRLMNSAIFSNNLVNFRKVAVFLLQGLL